MEPVRPTFDDETVFDIDGDLDGDRLLVFPLPVSLIEIESVGLAERDSLGEGEAVSGLYVSEMGRGLLLVLCNVLVRLASSVREKSWVSVSDCLVRVFDSVAA